MVKSIIDHGLVKLDNFRESDSKDSHLYLLTPKGVLEKATLVTGFLARKLEEYDSAIAEIQTLKADASLIKWGS